VPLLFLFLLGCSTGKKAEEVNPAPGWVTNRPVVEGHYIGIGSARKVGMQQEYVAEARKNALHDMAAQISARVSSTSVLHTIEDAYGVSESFSERIEIESDSYLTGFKPVDYYESSDQYWVYYRISRDEYQRNETHRREEALGLARAKYQSARDEASAHRPVEAIGSCLQGLDALKGFLGEDLKVGRELLSLLEEVVSGLAVTAMDEVVEVKRGSRLPRPLTFRVTYQGRPVPGVPVALHYTGGYLPSGLQETNEKGRVSTDPGQVTSGRSSASVEASLDHASMAANAVSDLFTRSILKNIPSAGASSMIEILSPLLRVQISSDGAMPDGEKRVRDLCRRKAEDYRLNPAGPEQDPDYSLHIRYRFEKGESAGSLTSVYLASELSLKDHNGQTIARSDSRAIKGVGHTTGEARQEAFQSFLTRLTRRSLDQLLQERF